MELLKNKTKVESVKKVHYVCITSLSFPSTFLQHTCLRGSKERAVAGKESPMAASIGTWPRITSHKNTEQRTARHGTPWHA